MTEEVLKTTIAEWFPSIVFEEGSEALTCNIEPELWLPLAEKLRHKAVPAFDFLFCLTCVDWKTHFTMVYHFRSTHNGQEMVVKAKLAHDNPEIETVSHIWRTAEFHEREVYDLFGVIFRHHPDLRRLLLTEEWKGYPLRKDYEDPVNMIKL